MIKESIQEAIKEVRETTEVDDHEIREAIEEILDNLNSMDDTYSFKFTVPGKPVAKGRPRFTKNGRRVRTPEKTRLYEQSVKWNYAAQVKNKKLLEGPIGIKANFYMYIPKNTSKVRRKLKEKHSILPTKTPDFDNLIKAVTDPLNGLAYKDDKQIVKAEINKYFSMNPRAEIEIYEIDKQGV